MRCTQRHNASRTGKIDCEDGSVRFMCSWATTLAAVEGLAEAQEGIV